LSGFPIAQSAPPPSSPSNNDQELLKLSAQGNIAEVELGRFAITRSTNPAVLNLGTRLAQDGSEGVANLQTVAAMLHVQLPMTPGPAQEGQIAKLRQLHGAAFDKRFAQIAHKDESQMLHQFQAGLTMAANGAVKSTIENMIPIVKEHLQIAQGIPASTSKSAMR
jgi:putative membrane protein